MNEHLVLLYLIIINAAGFLLMLTDKRKARRGAWRIPESTLIWIAILGGSAGVLTGMYLLRHKTRHLKFVLGVPLILFAQLALFFWSIR